MKQVVLGAVGALVLAGVGLFWWQGRAQVEEGAPPPEPVATEPAPDSLPAADIAGLRGPAPPEATELTREERRFFRYDRNRDRKISRNEMLSTRTDAFRALDKDGNNLLTFEEWAVTTVDRFEGADKDGNGELSAAEFATTAPKRPNRPACRC
ncbi:EF-hand domain-containing protein [Altererythrobacter sp. H2]|uniref:EF-hand domain-containing protein n=1 Tax=Altererythrobacter sp. H2 TaxID=3108391 RepID=UPI002B4BA519|nr:EF-hand domain-containing protein [Altererythrobacter sp. H2]WRK94340.1 EF-hand domain-containing protein [Altererythrobacter sp. H2]